MTPYREHLTGRAYVGSAHAQSWVAVGRPLLSGGKPIQMGEPWKSESDGEATAWWRDELVEIRWRSGRRTARIPLHVIYLAARRTTEAGVEREACLDPEVGWPADMAAGCALARKHLDRLLPEQLSADDDPLDFAPWYGTFQGGGWLAALVDGVPTLTWRMTDRAKPQHLPLSAVLWIAECCDTEAQRSG